jgi:hypothetical protein
MVVGFNHNFRYKGEVFHIQTEDSGVRNPHIVTLLYQGGTILASKKTSYADIARVDNLDQVVEELMKEQHKDMLRCLKAGEFDEVIERYQAGRTVKPQAEVGEPVKAEELAAGATARVRIESEPEPEPAAAPAKSAPPAAAEPKAAQPKVSPTVETSLDEVILSYLLGDDK